jgi:hypothetical protein
MRFLAVAVSQALATPLGEWLLRECAANPITKTFRPCEPLEMPSIAVDGLHVRVELDSRVETLFSLDSWSEVSQTLCGDVAFALNKLQEPLHPEKLFEQSPFIRKFVLEARNARSSSEWVETSRLKSIYREADNFEDIVGKVALFTYLRPSLTADQISRKRLSSVSSSSCGGLRISEDVWVAFDVSRRVMIKLINGKALVSFLLSPVWSTMMCGDLVDGLSKLSGELWEGIPRTIEEMRSLIEDPKLSNTGPGIQYHLRDYPPFQAFPQGMRLHCGGIGFLEYSPEPGGEAVLPRSLGDRDSICEMMEMKQDLINGLL